MEIKISEKYSFLEDFVKQIPSIFETEGTLFYQGRNLIKTFVVNGLCINVKRYHKPFVINQLVYSHFRKPKAVKAYFNAETVIEKGFLTPEPIAYILMQNSFGWLQYSYFVSLQLPSAHEIRDYYFTKGEGDGAEILKAFAKYTAQLHEAKILHLDYSPGNILYEKRNDSFQFSLVDINRMQFQDVDFETGCKNFCRLFDTTEAMIIIADEYAQVRGFDKQLCEERMVFHQRKFIKKTDRKDRLKELYKK